MKNLGDIINIADEKLGFLFYKNNNLLSYNLFSNLFEKKINSKFENDNKIIQSYKEKGFAIGPAIDIAKISKINNEISKQNAEKNINQFFLFAWSEELKNILKKIINEDLKDVIVKLQKYHNSPIIITHARIQRNYGYKKNHFEENFSDNFHNDRWLSTYIKIFINLEDIKENQGPTYIIPKNKTKDFVKITNYKSRNNYKKVTYNNTYINVGKSGDSLIFAPSECIHRAGIPDQEKKRDVLMLQFVVIPNYKKQDLNSINIQINNEEVFLDHDKLSYVYAKPYGFKKTLKLFKDFLNNKIEGNNKAHSN